jgi:hypothetical protein
MDHQAGNNNESKTGGSGLGVLGALLGSMILGGIPTFLHFAGEQREIQRREEERRAQMTRDLQKLQQDVQEGKVYVGSAMRSLMGERPAEKQ